MAGFAKLRRMERISDPSLKTSTRIDESSIKPPMMAATFLVLIVNGFPNLIAY